MGLSSGTKLGPYEIIAPVGAGGMGEVYRARDTRLDRTVAIKVLPSQLAENPDAKQRFDREARAISSLNHPNICTLHDVGEQGGVSYLVMEYLEGETLADRLSNGPLPIELVLRYGIEICDGLERAHRNSVVHRDLKPGNIMLTKAGAKLMDFGLAKSLVAPPAVSPSLTATLSTPMGSHPLTAQGTVVGTFQYMSPEQVEGKDADARSDIFAFGAVLYEMAAGKRAFEGKTAASAMAAVLERDPAPISTVQPAVPPALDRLVKTCLAKDPDDRWQTAHDVKLQLKQIAESGSQASAQAALPTTTPTPVPALGSKNRTKLPWVLATILGLITASVLLMQYLAGSKQLPLLRLAINPPPKTQFNVSGDNGGPAMLSPDGRYVVFSASSSTGVQLYLRPLESLNAQKLPGTEAAMFPFWSPDSRSVAFFTADKLKRIDIDGSSPVTICDSTLGRGGTWNQDGTIVAALSYNTGLSRIPASGGPPLLITKVDNVKYTSHRWPWFLPDGKHVIYVAVNHTSAMSPETGVFITSLDGSDNRLLFHSLANAVYATGRLLYVRENSLLAQSFDASTLKLTGEPQTLNENVQFDSGLWRSNLSVSATGNMVYASGAATGSQTLAWYDRTGKVLGTVGEPSAYFDLEISPDNKQLAVTDGNTSAATIWVYDLATKLKSRFTFSPGTHRTPVWSPDGREIAFTTNQQAAIARKEVSSGATDQILLSSAEPQFQAVTDWSADGRYLMYDQGSGIKLSLWVLPLAGDRKPFQYAPEGTFDGKFSPDMRWVAFQSNETGRPEVFIAPFPWTGAKWQVSTNGGTQPLWRGDGKELFFFDFSGIVSVEVNGSGPAFQVGALKPLFPRLALNGFSQEYSVTKDGQRFLAITPSEGGSQTLTLVQNWPAELRKK
jgi:eukaryotic-like serine/threonine-protein kinase